MLLLLLFGGFAPTRTFHQKAQQLAGAPARDTALANPHRGAGTHWRSVRTPVTKSTAVFRLEGNGAARWRKVARRDSLRSLTCRQWRGLSDFSFSLVWLTYSLLLSRGTSSET